MLHNNFKQLHSNCVVEGKRKSEVANKLYLIEFYLYFLAIPSHCSLPVRFSLTRGLTWVDPLKNTSISHGFC